MLIGRGDPTGQRGRPRRKAPGLPVSYLLPTGQRLIDVAAANDFGRPIIKDIRGGPRYGCAA